MEEGMGEGRGVEEGGHCMGGSRGGVMGVMTPPNVYVVLI